MMSNKKLIYYFHGFGSNANSDKIQRIEDFFGGSADVMSYDININPEIAFDELSERIMDDLVGRIHSNDNIIFIGTSLGAYWAYRLAVSFGVTCVMLNPSLNPKESLKKYNVPSTVCDMYEGIHTLNKVYPLCRVYIAENDEVIDYAKFKPFLDSVDVVRVAGESHRFNGPAFERVLADI